MFLLANNPALRHKKSFYEVIDMDMVFTGGIKSYLHLIVSVGIFFGAIGHFNEVLAGDESPRLSLAQAVVCETIRDLQPVNAGITFSIEHGKIMCFTRFAAITSETFILHRWYRRDELVSEKKLVLKPPQWSTYSSIQLRESDKGPWHVSIVDAKDQTITILRFSVTE